MKNFQEKLKRFVLLILMFCPVFWVMSQTTVVTTVFVDDFEGDNMDGGIPATTYTITKDVGAGTEPVDPTTTTTIGQLRIPNKKGSGFYGRVYVAGDLSVYSAPFTSKISEINADSVVWTLNMRQNYNSTLSGFSNSQNGVATILVADNSNFSLANGYAIAYGGDATKRYRLVKFKSGIYSTDNITTLVNGQTSLWSGREYMSFRVVYVVSSNTWKYYERVDGSGETSDPAGAGAFADPNAGTYNFIGSVVDSEHTNITLSSFGFLHNYSGNIDKIMWLDNYTVKTYVLDLGTSLEINPAQKFYKSTIVENEISIEANGARAILYNSGGAIVKSVNINGINKIEVGDKGFYILKMESHQGVVQVEKIIIR
ncbi:MAG: hypothetical protein VB102_14660 [Paludibacter sp.]|nr:hypothetical protein [Paludibacter sp.]